jgi:hypothetical protein
MDRPDLTERVSPTHLAEHPQKEFTAVRILLCDCGMGFPTSEHALATMQSSLCVLSFFVISEYNTATFCYAQDGTFLEILAFYYMLQSRQIRLRIQPRILVSL